MGVGTGADLGGVLGEGDIPEVRALLHAIGRYRTIGQIERTPGPWCPRGVSGPQRAAIAPALYESAQPLHPLVAQEIHSD